MGLFSLIGTVYSFAVTFATSGISLTVTRLVSSAIGEGRDGDVRGVLRAAVKYSLIFSFSSTLILFIFSGYFGARLLADARCVIPLRILSLSLAPIALSSVFSGYFIGVKRVGRNAVIQIAAQIFKIAVTTALVLRFAKMGIAEGICALAASMTLTELLVFLVALLQYLFDRRRAFKEDRRAAGHISAVSSMALPLAVSTYIRSALLTLEHTLIPKGLRKRGEKHSEALAHYGILHGMTVPMLLYPMAPLTSFSGLLVPEFSESLARGESIRLRRIATEAINATLSYSIAAAVLVAMFSEELGYAVYDSYEAGYYIAIMSPVIPIMYLDHVADSMLKGIGEHVYSMWVNISDSFLSIILVWTLIPRMGIGGYALVIVVMEGYNFILSASRLRKRIAFKIYLVRSVIAPLAASVAAVCLSRLIFDSSGRMTAPVWLFLRIVFAVCAFLGVYFAVKLALDQFEAKAEN